MKRASLLLLAFLAIALLFLSCGYSNPGSSSTPTSGLTDRAFLTQNVIGTAAILIVDAQRDVLSGVHVIAAGNTPGMMVVTPNRNQTLVFSGDGTPQSDNLFSLIDNAAENNARRVTLPGMTQSFVVSPDSLTAYVAVPTAPVAGQSPGAIVVINLATGSVAAQVPIVGVTYLSISHNGNRLLAFSANTDTLAVVIPSEIGNGNPVTTVSGFNRPVQAFFSNDDNTAFVVNCGVECGGTSGVGGTTLASVQPLTLTTPPTLGTPLNLPASSVATVVGTTMYLAGTPYTNGVPSQPCTGQQTAAPTCGLLTVVDLITMTVTNANPIVITDGYHDHIAMGANGQLFLGAHTCSEVLPSPQNNNETRGCLSVYNSNSGAVVIPPALGDVTGLQPIANRSVVYLVQNGELQIYDTSTDKLQATQIDISGHAVDVVTVDH